MNNFGTLFRICIFGESHGECVGILIDGVPAGIHITKNEFIEDLARRKSGTKGTTPRIEADEPKIMSGIFNDITTGSPIMIGFDNTNIKSKDYAMFLDTPRPGHADFTASKKYGGFADYRGGGHFSGRLTLGLVAAGVLAKKIIKPVKIKAKILEIGGKTDLEKALEKAIEEGDSIGGIIECRASNMPIGLGEPFFGSLDATLAHAAFSIPAIKGIEFGEGFNASRMKGSEHNDVFIDKTGKTKTNNAGGINGGISNGNDLVFRVAIKPTSSTSKPQSTFDFDKKDMVNFKVKGRHDVCIALRIPVIVEAMTAIVLADMFLLEQKYPRVNNL